MILRNQIQKVENMDNQGEIIIYQTDDGLNQGEIIIYQTDDGLSKIEVKMLDETV